MPRRRRYLARTHEHLSRAVSAHAAIVADRAAADEQDDAEATDSEQSEQSKRASSQHRDTGGKFR